MSPGGGARWRWAVLLTFGLLAAGFAYLNAGERTSVHLGVAVLFQVPLVGLVFVVFLLGMLAMYALGLRHDLRVRRLLRDHGLEELLQEPEEYHPAAPRPPDRHP